MLDFLFLRIILLSYREESKKDKRGDDLQQRAPGQTRAWEHSAYTVCPPPSELPWRLDLLGFLSAEPFTFPIFPKH